MSGIDEFLAGLRESGIKLWVEGDKLRIRAQEGALTPELTAQLKARKAEILALSSAALAQTIPPIPAQADYPLSPAQRRLWVLSQLDTGSCAYNIPLHQILQGPLNPAALAAALRRLVERHESLRTVFVTVDGEPRQVVRPGVETALPVEDLSQESDPEAAAKRLGRDESARAFDLEHGPLLRARLLRLSEQAHVLLFTLHHIIADGVSIAVLTRDLSRYYDAELTGQPDGLPPLAFGYPAYAVWQNQLLAGDALAAHRHYWLKTLAGELPVLNLPTDFPRPPMQTFDGLERSFTIAPDRALALREYCRARNASLFMLLHAALKTLLHRYTGQDDIIIGCATAGREYAGLEDQIGYYLNTVVLRSAIDGDEPFERFFQRVKQSTTEAFDHQAYPFDRLLDELRLKRDLSRFPLFDVMLVLQNQDEPGLAMGDIRAKPVFEHPGTSKFDLTFCCKDTPGGLVLGIEYNTALFLDARIHRIGLHVMALLDSIVANPNTPVGRLNLLSAEEAALIRSFNPPTPAPSACGTLTALFEAQAAQNPVAAAVIGEGRQLSYGELNADANRLAHRLRQLGVAPNALVGICVERGVDMLVGLLGILKAGAAYVPLDPAYPAERLAFMVWDAQIGILLTEPPLLPKLKDIGPQLLCLDSAELAGHSEANPGIAASADCAAYVIYTSGSTGQPKGVVVTHANVARLFSATEAWFGFGPDDVWTLFHSFAFDFSVWEIWGALLHGGKLVVVPYWASRSPQAFYRLLAEQRVTVLNQTPSAFRQLIQTEAEMGVLDLALRVVVFGGEALDLASLKPWFDRHGDQTPRLVNMYGITETTVHVTYRPVTLADTADAASLIGRPIPDLSVHLLDAHLQPVPIGVPGELHVGGAGLARGYLNRPELTEARFIADPLGGTGRLYKSGDLARYRLDGDIEYLGRIDSQVKIRGFRIELGEIEAALAAHSAVAQAVVEPRPDHSGDSRLLAWYAVCPGQSVTPAELRAHLADRLPDYMIPAGFMPLEALPLTPNGKVDRRALPLPDAAALASEAYAPPQTFLEQAIALIWQALLDVPQIGVHDNFFALGGHSLKATQFIAKLWQETGVRLDLIDVFREPSLAGLASLAAARGVENLPAPLESAPLAAVRPMTDEEMEMLND